MVIFFLKTKSEALTYLKQLYSLVDQELKVNIQRIRTYQGGEFKNSQFEIYTREKGIIHEWRAAYTSEQNGFIERSNRTIVEATRSMLHSRNLPFTLWAEAANTAVFIWNLTVSGQRSNTIPYEQLFNQVPDVSYFRVFGSNAYLHISQKHRKKLDAKSKKLILVGYDKKGRAYRLWHPNTKRITIAVDVTIHETLTVQSQDNTLCSSDPFLQIDFPKPQIIPTTATTVYHAELPTSSDRSNGTIPLLSEDSHHVQANDIFSQGSDHTVATEYFVEEVIAVTHNFETDHQGEITDLQQFPLNPESAPTSASASPSASTSTSKSISESSSPSTSTPTSCSQITSSMTITHLQMIAEILM